MDYVYDGTVISIQDDGYMVQVPALGEDGSFGPCQALYGGTAFAVGDSVAVAQMNGIPEDIIILGLMSNAVSGPPALPDPVDPPDPPAPTPPVPAGVVSQYAGTTAPTGYLMCSGQAVSRTTYADLFTAIGTTHGVGDGTTTFNVPNLVDKFVVGAGASALAATGGAATHAHALSDAAYAQITQSSTVTASRRITLTSDTYDESFRTTGTTGTALTGQTTATPLRGNVDSAPSVPPFVALNYIIKV